MRVRGPNKVERAVQTDPTLLRYASAITEQTKGWELLAQNKNKSLICFKLCATTPNHTQQHATGCETDANM